MRHFTHIADLGPDGVHALLARAAELKLLHAGSGLSSGPGSGTTHGQALPKTMRDLSLGMLFLNPSLRTRASFEMAMHKLGGHAIAMDTGAVWNLESDEQAVMNADRPEHVKEAAGVLSRYFDVLAVRAFAKSSTLGEEHADATINAFRRHASVPVISMESAREHPCQGLADMLTVREILGQTQGAKITLVWAPHIKALPRAVPNSLLLSAAAAGADIRIAHPPGYDLAPQVLTEARALAQYSDGKISLTDDRNEALQGAQIVYAKSWAPSAEFARAPDNPVLKAWMLGSEHFAQHCPEASFLHCLPVRRNVEVSSSLLDSVHARVIDQAANRLWVQMAALEWLLA